MGYYDAISEGYDDLHGEEQENKLAIIKEKLKIGEKDLLLDVGCGSGILAVSAAMLGAREVVATDSDRGVLPIALANARRNGVGDRIQFLEADLLPESCARFDLIVCNIVSQEVIRLAERLPASLSPGGRFIGSGFLAPSIPTVEEALLRGGLEMVEVLDADL